MNPFSDAEIPALLERLRHTMDDLREICREFPRPPWASLEARPGDPTPRGT